MFEKQALKPSPYRSALVLTAVAMALIAMAVFGGGKALGTLGGPARAGAPLEDERAVGSGSTGNYDWSVHMHHEAGAGQCLRTRHAELSGSAFACGLDLRSEHLNMVVVVSRNGLVLTGIVSDDVARLEVQLEDGRRLTVDDFGPRMETEPSQARTFASAVDVRRVVVEALGRQGEILGSYDSGEPPPLTLDPRDVKAHEH